MNTSSPLRIAPPPQDSSTSALDLKRTDAELLEAWDLDHEHDALAALVEKYASLVLGACRRQCRNAHDIEDAFQATFLQLARGAGRIRHPEALAGWLHRTAYRTARRAHDRQQREADPLLEDPPDPDHPLEQVARRHELRVLDEELAALPDRYRAAVALHFLEGRTHAQIAHQLGTTVGAVRGRLQRAKAQLRSRLRRRGVVPGAVVTAIALWPTDPAMASTLSDQFLRHVPETGGMPEPSSPDAPENLAPSLKPLLQGNQTVSISSLVLGGVAAATLGLVLLAGQLPGERLGQANLPADDGREPSKTITLNQPPQPDVLAQFGVGSGVQPGNQPASQGNPGGTPAGDPAAGGASSMMDMGHGPRGETTPPQPEPKPPSPTAQRIIKALDEPIEISGGEIAVSELETLGEQLDMPVLVDRRGIEAAEADGEMVTVDSSGVPLRTALRKMLRPLALKAVVEDEGLVITVDTAELARRGIGTSQWVSIDNDAAEVIEKKLDETANYEPIYEESLQQAVRTLSDSMEITILVDRRALEEIGLTSDVPVTLQLSGVSWRTVLDQMLVDLDLRYVNRGEFLQITTAEAAEGNLLGRIYWLDATGVYADFDDLMNAIQMTVEPDTWEAMGGASTMTPLMLENRGALLVSTTTEVHHEIEKLLDLMRKNYFGEAKGFHSKPPTQLPGSNRGMWMGGGSFGGMGGGMGGMGGMM